MIMLNVSQTSTWDEINMVLDTWMSLIGGNSFRRLSQKISSDSFVSGANFSCTFVCLTSLPLIIRTYISPASFDSFIILLMVRKGFLYFRSFGFVLPSHQCKGDFSVIFYEKINIIYNISIVLPRPLQQHMTKTYVSHITYNLITYDLILVIWLPFLYGYRWTNQSCKVQGACLSSTAACPPLFWRLCSHYNHCIWSVGPFGCCASNPEYVMGL